MAGAIKGITIEFDGNTTKLSKALESVNKESKSLQSELRGINSLLKMDPSSTELLSQKQKILAESISATKDKLETLKSVQAQVNEQFEKGDIGEKEYRDFQREIEATEQKLKSLTNEMKEFGSVSAQQIAAAGEKVKEVGGKIESAGKAFAPVSAAAAAAGAASVAAFKQLDEGYDTIVRATGATGTALEGLKNSANNVFGSMNADMATVGSAIGEVNTRFGYTDEQLEKTTSLFLKFADITGQDVVTAVGNTDKIMEAWNIDASRTEELLGMLSGKAQETGISVDTLENAVMSNSATFKEMGLSLEESIALMAQFEANGVDAGTAVAGLKKAVQNATKEGLTADEALQRTIDSIKNASSETEALSIASELFGNKGAAEMVRAIKEGRLSLDDLNASMSDYANTVSDTYEATLDPLDKLQIAFNNLKIVGAELGASILDAVQPMFDKLVEGCKSLLGWFDGLSDGTKQMIVVGLGIVASIAPVLMTVGKLTQGLGSIMTMAPKIQGVFSALAGVIGGISGPVLAIVAAIGVLIAAFATLWKTNEEFRGKILSMWEEIKESSSGVTNRIVELFQSLGFNVSNITDVIKTIWNGFCNFLAPIFEYTFANLKTTMTAALDALSGILDIFIGIFTGDWSRAWEGVKTVFESIWEYITGRFQNWYNLFIGIYGGALDTIATVWSDAWNGICSFFSDIWNSIAETAQNAWNSIVSFFTAGIPNFMAKIKEWFNQIPYNIGNALGVAIGNVTQWVVDMVNKAHEMGSNFIAKVVEFFTQLPTKTAEFAGKTFDNIKTWASNMTSKASEMANTFLSNIVNTIKELPSKLQSFLNSALSNVAAWVSSMGSKGREAITSLINNAVSAASSIPSKMGEIGRNIVDGVWNGIVAAKNAFVNNVTNFFRGIVDGVKDALGIHSPSTKFADEVGYWIPPGIGMGIEKNAEAAVSPIKRLFDDLFSSDLTPVCEFTANAAPTVISNDYSAILSMMSIIADKLGNNKIYLDGKTLVGAVINYIDKELSRISAQKARGM